MSRLHIVIGIGLVAVGLLIGRWTAPTAALRQSEPAPPTLSAHHASEPTSRRTAAAQARPFLVRPVAPFETKNEEAERQYRSQQAHDLMGLLRRRAAMGERMNAGGGPEAAANVSNEYLTGWADSVIRTAPDLLDELASEITSSMCTKETSPTELIVLSRAIRIMPEVADTKGFECLFSSHRSEDVVLWSALAAWSASGLPKTAALESLEQTATDPRTARLFLSPDERRALRLASASERVTAEEGAPTSPTEADETANSKRR